MKRSAYRCFLPDLTGFAADRCEAPMQTSGAFYGFFTVMQLSFHPGNGAGKSGANREWRCAPLGVFWGYLQVSETTLPLPLMTALHCLPLPSG